MSFDWDAALEQAIAHHKNQEFGRAEAAYQHILKAYPECAEAFHLLGVLGWQTKRFEFALDCITKAISRNDSQPSFYLNLANVYYSLNQFEKAEEVYRKSLLLDASCVSAHNNLGMTLQELGRFEEALLCYRKSIELNPNSVETYNHLGVVFRELGRLDQAYDAYKQVLSMQPNNHHFHCNLGIAYYRGGKYQQAKASFEKTIELNPNNTTAYYSLGAVLNALNNTEGAIDCYRQVLKLNPKDTGALSCLYRDLQERCSWDELKELGDRLDACTDELLALGKRTKETPLLSIRRSQDPTRHLRVAESWSEHIVSHRRNRHEILQFEKRQTTGRPLKIGYLSGCFGDSPVAHLIRRLFEVHNRENVHCTMYSYDRDETSSYFQELRAHCDTFRSFKTVSDVSASQCIAQDKIDILVDLMGHTKDNRLAICSFRPAPIQITYLGFPGSVGSSMFDYVLTDEQLLPPQCASDYTENFVYLPHCYQINNDQLAIAPGVPSREEEGLPSKGFVFCCFNRSYKITEAQFDLWMGILRRVEGSVLWLLHDKTGVDATLKRQAQRRGVAPQRLIFSPRVRLDKHLRRLQLASLALDTLTYNGGITTSHTLWAGVPVLTVTGNYYVSRMSSSLLNSLGLNELVVSTWEQYEDEAVKLATDSHRLEAIREKIAKNRECSPLFDTECTGRSIERAYQLIWQRYINEKPPCLIRVSES